MPIAIPCLCFALAKLETEWKSSVTAGSTNTAATDRTIRLYRPQRARRGCGESHIPFQKCAGKMAYCLLESKTSKPNVSNNSWQDKKNTVKKSQTWSHPFLQHECSKMQLIILSKSLQKSKLPSSSSASSLYRAEVHPPLNSEVHLGCGGLSTRYSPHRGFQELFYVNFFKPQTPSLSQVFLSSPVTHILWKKFPSPYSFSYPYLHNPPWKKREGEDREIWSGPFTEGCARCSKSCSHILR